MKKHIIYIGLIFVLLLACTKPITIDNVDEQPNFKGVVKEVSEESNLLIVNEDEQEIKSSDLISVSLEVELIDSLNEFEIGDLVTIYYDGIIMETYPAQINKVYAIILNDTSTE